MNFLDAYYKARRDNYNIKHEGRGGIFDPTDIDLERNLHKGSINIFESNWCVVPKPKKQPKFKIHDIVDATPLTGRGVVSCKISGISVDGNSYQYSMNQISSADRWIVSEVNILNE